MILGTDILKIRRLPRYKLDYPEIKDPNIVVLSDGHYLMYASIGRSIDQTWLIGRFRASNIQGPWQEIAPAKIVGLSGPQLCAPAVTYDTVDGKGKWIMYLQTACFVDGGIIAELVSDDGKKFTLLRSDVVTSEAIKEVKTRVIGVYDPGISEIKLQGEEMLALVFSGYRQIGSGDLYLSHKKKNDSSWSEAKLILMQEDVPFHNKPGSPDFEWGLEGGKLIQVSEDCFLLVAVCFLPLPHDFRGRRQRVFFAASRALYGPYIPLGVAFQPQEQETGSGEHGHSDTIIDGNDLWIIYQERSGEGRPWHLRYVRIDYEKFALHARQTLTMYPLK